MFVVMKEDADNIFNRVDKRYKTKIELIKNMQTPDVNKHLCISFMEACQVGMCGQKIGIKRLMKTAEALYSLMQLLPENRVWHYVTKADVTSMLLKIQEKPTWSPWSQYTPKIILRKFVKWLREEYSYPEGYPNREKMINMQLSGGYPYEVRYHLNKPIKYKPTEEIPTQEEVDYLIQACDSQIYGREGIRDKAIITILAETGLRVGGLGTLFIKNVTFDSVGALLTIHDKTMNGEPVRVIKTVPYLKAWLDAHPDKSNPEAPLWINLGHSHKYHAMNYAGMRTMLRKAVQVHNELAEIRGLPKITRRIHFHAFRYFAQTRDMVEGMPVSIQCKRRGWSPTSRQPMMYARVTSDQVDKWLIEHA